MYETEFEAAKKAALQAGKFLKGRIGIHVDSAEGKDIKLSSDKESERMLMDELGQFGYSILSEEFGLMDRTTDLYWIIDPIDGTMNYSRGMDDLACVSVALWNKSEPVLGVINRFRTDEIFSGRVGDGAWLNGHPIRTSAVAAVKDAILATGFPVKRSYDSDSLGSFVSDIQRFKKIRMLGTAAVMGAFVSCGYIDAYMEESIMLWDVAAAAAIVGAAGGVSIVKDVKENKCKCILFANQALYEDYINA